MSRLVIGFILLICLIGAHARGTAVPDGGDIIKVTSNKASISVLLDEFPSEIQPQVISYVSAQSDAWWKERVFKQLSYAQYRLTFRITFYPDKKQLVLPEFGDAYDIQFQSAASVKTIEGHKHVVRTYTATTYIIGRAGDAVVSDSALGKIGGYVKESYVFPLDPTLLLQRTAYACMDEDQFPRNSVDAETTDVYYDDTCTPGDALPPTSGGTCFYSVSGCHCSYSADKSCDQAIHDAVGRSRVVLTFTRVAWSENLARRIESYNSEEYNPTATGADLLGYLPALNHNWVAYKYFEPTDCALFECLGANAVGWRRLIIFDAVHTNVGNTPINFGTVSYTPNMASSFDPSVFHNMYYYSPCHGHPHFSAFAAFNYGTQPGLKQGFCVQTTNRIINHRNTPIYTPYDTCLVQGISPGWADNYNGGIPCNWVDVTNSPTGTSDLGVVSNPKSWLCEGDQHFNTDGTPIYTPTGEVTTHPPYPTAGLSIDKFACDQNAEALSNNRDTIPRPLGPHGKGLLTSPCNLNIGTLGPKRDCEFFLAKPYESCTPGSQVTLSCSLKSTSIPQVLRVCESSVALGTGLACRYNDDSTLANVNILSGPATTVTFTCPAARDSVETGGRYSFYVGPIFNKNVDTTNPAGANTFTCTVAH